MTAIRTERHGAMRRVAWTTEYVETDHSRSIGPVIALVGFAVLADALAGAPHGFVFAAVFVCGGLPLVLWRNVSAALGRDRVQRSECAILFDDMHFVVDGQRYAVDDVVRVEIATDSGDDPALWIVMADGSSLFSADDGEGAIDLGELRQAITAQVGLAVERAA